MFDTIARSLAQWEWIGQLLARVSVGLLFLLSGRGKLFVPARRAQMRETIASAGLPAPDIMAPLMSTIEFVGGGILCLGLLTPIACALLIGVMGGALVTVQLRYVKGASVAEWLGNFLYLPEVLYIVILVWLFFAGPGWVSLDRLLLSA